jgi:hypothetical protein
MKKTKKPTAKSVQAEFDAYKTNVRAYVMAERNLSNKRRLMSIAPSNDKGLINGLTIPELVMLVNLSDGTGETIVLETENNKHDLLVIAKKKAPRTPWELL